MSLLFSSYTSRGGHPPMHPPPSNSGKVNPLPSPQSPVGAPVSQHSKLQLPLTQVHPPNSCPRPPHWGSTDFWPILL